LNGNFNLYRASDILLPAVECHLYPLLEVRLPVGGELALAGDGRKVQGRCTTQIWKSPDFKQTQGPFRTLGL